MDAGVRFVVVAGISVGSHRQNGKYVLFTDICDEHHHGDMDSWQNNRGRHSSQLDIKAEGCTSTL
jgi:polyribonucleotide nucleotidyltransferase